VASISLVLKPMKGNIRGPPLAEREKMKIHDRFNNMLRFIVIEV
jgi:hypothetical protein